MSLEYFYKVAANLSKCLSQALKNTHMRLKERRTRGRNSIGRSNISFYLLFHFIFHSDTSYVFPQSLTAGDETKNLLRESNGTWISYSSKGEESRWPDVRSDVDAAPCPDSIKHWQYRTDGGLIWQNGAEVKCNVKT